MPKNYQISQYEEPLAEHGRLVIDTGPGPREIGIQRVHLEEDVGKLVHEGALETAQSSQRGLQPRGRAADGDRLQARSPQPGRGRRLPEGAARHRGLPGGLRRQHGGGLAALRRQHLAPAARAGRVRHQGRDQEHELVPQRPGRARVRDPRGRPARSTPASASCRRRGSGTRTAR